MLSSLLALPREHRDLERQSNMSQLPLSAHAGDETCSPEPGGRKNHNKLRYIPWPLTDKKSNDKCEGSDTLIDRDCLRYLIA